jgi:hypothetical protein
MLEDYMLPIESWLDVATSKCKQNLSLESDIPE